MFSIKHFKDKSKEIIISLKDINHLIQEMNPKEVKIKLIMRIKIIKWHLQGILSTYHRIIMNPFPKIPTLIVKMMKITNNSMIMIV